MAITLGALHTWAAAISHSMNADGISYLDIGDAYLRGDWQTAINPVWSPLYSWILGPVMYLLKPSMRWEFPVVHLVNFAIYLGALVSFEFFWRQLRYCQQAKTAGESARGEVTLPEWAWLALGYMLFIWSSLNLIEIWAVTPDMLMAALVYLAAGLIVRIRQGAVGWSTFALFGAVLGLGYLAKTIMFPLSFVFLGVSLFSIGNIRRATPRVLLALLVFLLVSLPFITLISKVNSHLTFGEAGKLTYVRYVNGIPYPHWQGGPPGNGAPEHPSRKIFESPPIYEFGTPIRGTYPISLNPAYWYQGVVARFDLDQQMKFLLANALFFIDLFIRRQGGVLAGLLILYALGRWRPERVTEIVPQWGLLIIALVALGMYALVLVAERYIGVFVVLLWAELFARVRLPNTPIFRRLLSVVSIIIILSILLNILAFNLEGFGDLTGGRPVTAATRPAAGPPSWPGEVAEALHRLGVQPGDQVAVIGYAFDSFWARLARVQIVAEMLDRDAHAFWLGDPAFRSEVISAFASTGAQAIVAERVPSYTSLNNWHRVGDTNYYVYILYSPSEKLLPRGDP